jgi:hypothetical protein
MLSTKFHWTVSPALTVVVVVLVAESTKTFPGPTFTRCVNPAGGTVGVGVGCPPGVGVAAGGVTTTGCVGEELSPQATAKSISAAVTARSNERLMGHLQKETGKSVLHRERHADGLPPRHGI